MSNPVEQIAAHRPYGLDCKCGRPINSDMDWARHQKLSKRRLTSPWIEAEGEK